MMGKLAARAARVAMLGPKGDVLVSITGSKGSLPLLFGPDELQGAHISDAVRRALDRAAL
jgi:hypothetical protein